MAAQPWLGVEITWERVKNRFTSHVPQIGWGHVCEQQRQKTKIPSHGQGQM